MFSEKSKHPQESSVPENPEGDTSLTLAHLSDPHISCMEDIRVQDLANKRLFGFLRWKLHRGAEHGAAVLPALQIDLNQTKPDHIAVTGDLTHLGLPAEYLEARKWLQSLGSPSQITVIPGNHDAYVKSDWQQTLAHWTDYMISDTLRDDPLHIEKNDGIFPILRIRGRIAIVGVNTAHPSAPHLAVGRIGTRQLKGLETILDQTARMSLFRVILIHHPPAPGTVSWRKRLTDAAELRMLLDRYGADLILHGHAHRILHTDLPTRKGSIPVMGVPSISALGRTPDRRARYYIYRIMPDGGNWKVRLEVRIYSPEKDCFVRESKQNLNDN